MAVCVSLPVCLPACLSACLSACLCVQLKVDAVLEVMQKAVVPWSDMVEKLVQQYLEMKGPK